MKAFKKTVCAALCLAMVLALCACGKQTNDIAEKPDDKNKITNPIHESSAEEFESAGWTMPEIGGKTPVYTTIDGDETLYQADYGTFTVRVQKTDKKTDISGMNYEWKEESFNTLELLQGDPVFETDGNGAGVVYWYLADHSWSVGMAEGASIDTLKDLYFAVFNANFRGSQPVVG